MSSPRSPRIRKPMVLRPGPGALLEERRFVRHQSRRENELLRNESPPPALTKKIGGRRVTGLRADEEDMPFEHLGYRGHPELNPRKARKRHHREVVVAEDEEVSLSVDNKSCMAPWRADRSAEPERRLTRRPRRPVLEADPSASPSRFAQETSRVRAVSSRQLPLRRPHRDEDPTLNPAGAERDGLRRTGVEQRGQIARVKKGVLKSKEQAHDAREGRLAAARSRSRDHAALCVDSSPEPRRRHGWDNDENGAASRRAQQTNAEKRKQKRSSSSASSSSSAVRRRRSLSKKRAIEKRLRSRCLSKACRTRTTHHRSRKRVADRRPVRRTTRSRSPVFSRVRQMSDGQSMQQQRAIDAKLRQIAAQQPQGLPFWKRGRLGGARPPVRSNRAAAVALPAGLLGGAPRSALGLPERKAKLGPGLQGSVHPDKYSAMLWEEPRVQRCLQLIGETCIPDGSVPWEYILQDESRRSYAGFRSNCFTKEETRGFFDNARRGTKWLQPTGPSGSAIPRKTAWLVSKGCRCAYRYGQIEVPPQEYPPWMNELMQMVMPFCGITSPQAWPTCCNVNLYEDGGMSVGWHADDERLFQGKFQDIKIISLSLGAKRKFELRANWPEDGEAAVKPIFLEDGDLLTMEGMLQKHYQHRVPKEGHVHGSRINLTWRWIVSHTPQCPVPRARR
mmetsp:Transcript_56841/g.133520  ORF Transcript_56841/g.133520 Transcript_56841/m.133520 type:complete len:676 (+) Transcript_56841:106-2133(+)